ncbi:MAG TPA: hypothetical protein VFN61_13320 [Acidimicrobiales bacterium]|nr:hypothetical protein [Acidimicrobiales bacterium]
MPQRRYAQVSAALALSAGMSLAATVAALAPPAWSATRVQAPHVALASSHQVHSSVSVKTIKVGKYGEILVDQAGLPLYYNSANKLPKHWACTGGCLGAWPPLLLGKGQKAPVHAKSLTGLGAVRGPSGLQVTWHGKPLYTYSGDSKGAVTGQGLGGVWYVAQVKMKAATGAGSSW